MATSEGLLAEIPQILKLISFHGGGRRAHILAISSIDSKIPIVAIGPSEKLTLVHETTDYVWWVYWIIIDSFRA